MHRVLWHSPIGCRPHQSSNPLVSRRKTNRCGSENRSDWHLIARSGENSGSWQAAAAAANNLNQSLNKLNVNGKITRILFLSTRTNPRQEVELEASREKDSKVTQVAISSPLPKPDIGSE